MGTLEEDHNEMRERVAALEHEQWVAWSREVARTELISDGRRYRWSQYWIPYDDLPDEVKEEDRKWADKVIQVIVDQVIYM